MRTGNQTPTAKWQSVGIDEQSPESPSPPLVRNQASISPAIDDQRETVLEDSPPAARSDGDNHVYENRDGDRDNHETSSHEPVHDKRRWPWAPFRGLRYLWRLTGSAAQWCFGLLSLIIGLAFLAAIPLVQFLSLGYLLEVGGRIARTGRLSSGFIGVRRAAHVGSIVLGTWLILLPLRYLATFERDAQLIDPDSGVTQGWIIAMNVLTGLAVLHILGAWARGGRLRYFFLPIINPMRIVRAVLRKGAYREARDAVWDFIAALRLPYYFSLGLRGFFTGLVWLFIPVSLIAAGLDAPIFSVVGAVLLMFVAMYLPILQTRFAAENRSKAMFEVRVMRDTFARAPVAFFVALFVTLALALPLYFLKIEMVPQEVAWLPSVAFVVFMLPARFACGWAYARASRRETGSRWFVRVPSKTLLVPVVAIYVAFVFFMQLTAWNGIGSLYEQHAFLLPVPFNEMP